MTDRHTGGCQCGAVRYETRGAPVKAVLCHCRYCQLRTGSAFGVSAYFPKEAVTIVSGSLRDYAFETESGRAFTQRFCDTCGSTLFWVVGAMPELTGVAAGSFDPPSFWFDVPREVFTRTQAPFVHTDIADTSETSSSYTPAGADDARLRGA